MNHWLTVELCRHRDDLKKAKLKTGILKITEKGHQRLHMSGKPTLQIYSR